jgi:hypothetical protein
MSAADDDGVCRYTLADFESARLSAARVETLAVTQRLSAILDQNREDNGMRPHLLGREDAAAVKRTWDLWFSEQIQLPDVIQKTGKSSGTLTKTTRHTYRSGEWYRYRKRRERDRWDLMRFVPSWCGRSSPRSWRRPSWRR